MTVTNHYIANQLNYIKVKMQQPLVGFSTPNGKQASWDDIAIKFTNTEGVTQNFLFHNAKQRYAKFTSTFINDDRLSQDSHHLLFAYLLDVLKEDITITAKHGKQSVARQFLGNINQNIALTSEKQMQHVIDKMKHPLYLTQFFEWLYKHKLISTMIKPNIRLTNASLRAKSGDDALLSENSKLPSEKNLLAIGAIFHDVIPPYKEGNCNNISDWYELTHSTLEQRDAFTCVMAALAMSSPNRVAAEQPLLSKQRIQTRSEIIEGKESVVHFLNYRGSKGFADNQKHINKEMAESVDRALHFIGIVTEPARVLARFYQDPKRPLNDVLGDFSPNKDNFDALKPSMTKPTSLIHLGLLLGFYDGTDKTVRVTPESKGAIALPASRGNNSKYIKPIADLSLFDSLVLVQGCPMAAQLLGTYFRKSNPIYEYIINGTCTVAEFQNHHVLFNQKRITGFNRKQTKRVNYDNALFAFTERQITSKKGGAYFSLTPIASLETTFSNDLRKHQQILTIFERHGFSSTFSIRPHQFRHWQNDYLDKKGLPHLLITMLSGRKSPEQTLRYIHTTNAQNASVIADIMIDTEIEEDIEGNIQRRIQSQEQYQDAVENLTPTFISDVGFCSQNLTLFPCTYMNDFDSQCALCSSSCHVAHDKEAIYLLRSDLKVQTNRLKMVQNSLNFEISEGMQKWYLTHYRNTCMLKELISVISDKNLKEGSIVRLLSRSNVMRITDLETKTIVQRSFVLPNAYEALKIAIEAKKRPPQSPNSKSNYLDFLSSI
ncbi:hypothetical protein AB4274_01105 [Vibrio sp. 10N.261.55.A10]|uniref:hypothetical protein n=1 Tax=Vibrio sp. 10N.261.55.A10 TaxID=3229687 RepID=UPI00354F4AC7